MSNFLLLEYKKKKTMYKSYLKLTSSKPTEDFENLKLSERSIFYSSTIHLSIYMLEQGIAYYV
jgi:hypothetical protein